MLLNKGLIRVSIGVPATAEFAVTGIDDPHNCAETTPAGLALIPTSAAIYQSALSHHSHVGRT